MRVVECAPSSAVPSGATCGPHGAAAEAVCFRCGTFVCPACRRWQAEKPLCLDCVARLGSKPSRAANVALLLSTLGFCGFVTGIAGLILAHRELARIRRCESPGAGQSQAEFARNLGWFHVALLGLAVLIAALRWS